MYTEQQIKDARNIQADCLEIGKILANPHQVPMYIGLQEYFDWVSVYFLQLDDAPSIGVFYFPVDYLTMRKEDFLKHWNSCVVDETLEYGLLG